MYFTKFAALSKCLAYSEVELRSMVSDGNIEGHIEFVLWRQNKTRADSRCWQQFAEKLIERRRNLPYAGETRKYPPIRDTPSVLSLHGIHLLVAIPPVIVTPQVSLAAKRAKQEKRRVVT